jgi:uncharacterized FAD-dependent dehydrogenase
MKKYDYIFIGAGIASLMAVYQIKQTTPNATICILEKGNNLDDRKCPLLNNKVDKCVKCSPCNVVSGEAGSGCFNDGKTIKATKDTKDYGGWLDEYIGQDKLIKYTNQVDEILSDLIEEKYPLYYPSVDFKKECLKYDLHNHQAIIRHNGSDGNLKIMTALIKLLKEQGVEIFCNIKIQNISIKDKLIKYHDKWFLEEHLNYDKLIIAVGRTGTSWFVEFCKNNNIPLENNRVDIGVRVEVDSNICSDIAKTIYEPKIWVKTKPYGDIVRTFCWNNGNAKVCVENNDGVLSVNGFANSEKGNDTGNSNFALLSSIKFSTPFDKPTEYARYVASLSNMIAGNNVLVQKFGDLISGKRSTKHRLSQSTVIPTLPSAEAGDLSLALPKRILDNIIDSIYQLNNIIPGISNYDTLLYSPEIKMYSSRPQFLNDKFEILKDVFSIGDCSGVTRSVSQAGGMGLYLIDQILEKEKI